MIIFSSVTVPFIFGSVVKFMNISCKDGVDKGQKWYGTFCALFLLQVSSYFIPNLFFSLP